MEGTDRGVDGLLYFYEGKDERARIIVQVKGGGVKRDDVATLLGDVNNQKAAGGVLLTLEKPTKPMQKEAIDAGRYTAKLYQKDYPKIQILTVAGLLAGSERLEAPPQANPFAKAEQRSQSPQARGDAVKRRAGMSRTRRRATATPRRAAQRLCWRLLRLLSAAQIRQLWYSHGMERKIGIVVVAHGSRRAESNETLLRFVAQLRQRLGHERIEPAFMERGEPTIPDAVQRLLTRGCNHIVGFALFLVPGTHLSEDIPRQFERALEGHSGVTFEISPPLLENPAMIEVVTRCLQWVSM